MIELAGIGASIGVAIGPASMSEAAPIVLGDIADPLEALDAASGAAALELEARADAAREAGHDDAAAVLSAQALMARDPMLLDEVRAGLGAGVGLQAALRDGAKAIADLLSSLDDEYLAARAADVGEVADRILACAAEAVAGRPDSGGPGAGPDLRASGAPNEDSSSRAVPADGAGREPVIASGAARVIVARALSAADTAALSAAETAGLVIEEGGPTGHVAVIARSLGIPAVVGAHGATAHVVDGETVALNGDTGEVAIRPDAETVERFIAARTDMESRQASDAAYTGRRVTFGEVAVAIAANVAGPLDVDRASEVGADGIGLYRTEFLFSDRDEPPSEDEQYGYYRDALCAFDQPVVIRLADIGGDKPVPWLGLETEDNPFLGERGPRLYELRPELLATQLRALLRAAAHGELLIMVPMVATVEDLVGVRSVLEAQRAALRDEGVECADLQLGVMIEVPSAALIAEQLAAHVDFFSLGTNDLAQYTLAADRTNARLARYNDVAHPAVLGLCARAAAAAANAGISISVCGEAAADPELAPAFAAMGVTRLSVSVPAVNAVKALIDGADAERTHATLETAMAAVDASLAREALASDVLGMPHTSVTHTTPRERR